MVSRLENSTVFMDFLGPDLQERVLQAHHRSTDFTTILYIDTLSDNPCVRVLWPTIHQSGFPKASF